MPILQLIDLTICLQYTSAGSESVVHIRTRGNTSVSVFAQDPTMIFARYHGEFSYRELAIHEYRCI